MQSEVPSQSLVWVVLAARFQSELPPQKSEIWRLSGLLEEYGPAVDDHNRTIKQLMQVKTMKQMHSRLEPKLINLSAIKSPPARDGTENCSAQ